MTNLTKKEIVKALENLKGTEFDADEIICALDTEDVIFVEDAGYVPVYRYRGLEDRVTTYNVYTENGDTEDVVQVETLLNEAGEQIITEIF